MAKWMLKASEPSVGENRPLSGNLGFVPDASGGGVSVVTGSSEVENQAIS